MTDPKPANKLPQSFDAKDWVREWLETIKENPGIPTDEGTMLAWFANAIMAGWDEHARRAHPQQSAEPVAQLEVRNGIAGLKHLLAPIDQVSDGMMLYRASPGPPELVEEMENLVKELHDEANDKGTWDSTATTLNRCADSLSALITRWRGKS